MKYFIDTGNIDEVLKWKDYIQGVTTNPTLLKESDMKSFLKAVDELNEFITFIQVHTWNEYLKLVSVKNELHLKNEVIAKIPLIYPQGYDLIRKIKTTYSNSNNKIRICGTVTYNTIQLHQAIEIGCDYCIVLIAKNDNHIFLEEALQINHIHPKKIGLIGASFRTKTDVRKALLSGIQYITLSPKIFKLMFNNEQTNKDWRDIYGN